MPVAPNTWQGRARDVFDLYLNAELALLRAVSRRLAKGIDRPGWAEQKYAEARVMRQEAETALALLSGDTAPLYASRISGAYDGGSDAAYADIRRAMGIPALTISASRVARVDSILDELRGKLSAQRMSILRRVDDEYRRVIGYGVADLATGSINLRQSVQRSLDAFAAAGITSFVDSAGRSWGMPEYAEMATRTGMMRAALAGYADAAVANGQDLIIITDHSDECPLCTPWENAVLSLTGAQRNHPDCKGTLDEAVSAGLFHPNCLHSFSVYIPGLTRIGGGDRQTPEQNAQGYQNRQQMRYMERQVRSWKRRQAAAIDPIDERRAKSFVDQWQAKLRALTAATGLPRGVGREGPRVPLSGAAKLLGSRWIEIAKSLGAAAKNYKVLLPDGNVVKFMEGTRITNVAVIAGKGRDRKIDEVDRLVDKYGGSPDLWQKMKGFGYLNVDGESRKADVHWYEEDNVGRVDFKLKVRRGGEWYFDEG